MNNIWKITTILLLVVSFSLAFFLYKNQSKPLKINQISLDDIDVEDYEYKKKQDPKNAQDVNDYFFKNQTKIRFFQDLYDFDTVKQGVSIERDLKYINEGSHPFFITEVKVSCGCTVPSYDKKPVQPNDTGIVRVQFNSIGKEGFIMNKLSVYGNVENEEKSTYFKVFVNKK